MKREYLAVETNQWAADRAQLLFGVVADHASEHYVVDGGHFGVE